MMSQFRSIALLLVAGLITAAAPALEPAPVPPDDKDARMAWWREARFGMFIHWGVYSVPGGEYKGLAPDNIGEWIMENAKIPVSEYEQFATQFNPVKYDAKEWVQIAKDAGVKYIVITSKHHDGFCLFDSQLTDWDITRTPLKKDLLRPLADACKDAGIKFCTYFTIMDWHHPDYSPRRKWNDVASKGGPPQFDRFVKYVNDQVAEVIKGYDPAILWFDGEWEDTWTVEHGKALEKHVRELKPSIIVNNRVGKSRGGMGGLNVDGTLPAGDYGTPEQEIPARGLPGVDWETCMTMNNTWGFKKNDHNWKSATQLTRMLIDIASKGGNFLLNVGPTPEGEIPAASVERLREMGKWLKVNGEAIYGTSASPFPRVSWGRCTQKPGKLYLHVFDWPADGKLLAPGLKTEVKKAYLLASPAGELKTARSDEGVTIAVPSSAPNEVATVVVLEIAGKPELNENAFLLSPDAAGVVTLRAADATLTGGSIGLEQYPTGDGTQSIGFWTDPAATARWEFRGVKPGKYRVELTMACDPESAGSEFVVRVGKSQVAGMVEKTQNWRDFVVRPFGELEIAAADKQTLVVEPRKKPGQAVMNLRAVKLTPVK
jgi:alpha-L-fucosidase